MQPISRDLTSSGAIYLKGMLFVGTAKMSAFQLLAPSPGPENVF